MTAKDFYRYLGVAGVAVILFPVPVLAAQMVSREYERRTLDCLLVTPLESEEILLSKFHASVLGTRWALAGLAVVFIVAAASGVIHRLAFVMLVVSWLVTSNRRMMNRAPCQSCFSAASARCTEWLETSQ